MSDEGQDRMESQNEATYRANIEREARREGYEAARKQAQEAVRSEEELAGEPPEELFPYDLGVLNMGAFVDYSRAIVRVTKRNIEERIRIMEPK